MGADPGIYVQRLIFFDDMEIQKVKINVLHKAVRAEARSGVSLKIPDVGIEPDGTAQVEGTADLLQCAEYFVGAGILCAVADGDIPD